MLYTFQALKSANPLPAIGKKAASLIELLHWNLPVPDGVCLSADALEFFIKTQQLSPLIAEIYQNPETESQLQAAFYSADFPAELKEPLQAFLNQHPEASFAVRSSGAQEDLAGASFAGMYQTCLNIQGLDQIIESIKTCWLSLFSPRVRSYIQAKGLNPHSLQMGVIIQTLIPAEKSGVLFSVNPVQGLDQEMQVEAVWGLGEGLVSGQINPDQYFYDWGSKTLVEKIQAKEQALRPILAPPFTQLEKLSEAESLAPVLKRPEIEALVALALKIQAGCGYPVDIEWAIAQDTLYLLQSRPITHLTYQGIAGEWTTADFKDGGVSSDVCTPLMWSLYDFIWEITMPSYLRRTHLLDPDQESALWGKMFFGRPYWNVGAVKAGLKKLPGFVEREFDEDLGIEVSYSDQGYTTPTNPKTLAHGLRVLNALKHSFNQQLDYCEVFALRQAQRLQELNVLPIEAMGQEAFFEFYEHFILYDYFQSEASYFYLIFDNSNITTLFKDSFKPYKDQINYLALISGLENLSHLKQNYDLWDLSREILNQPTWLAFWQNTPVPELFEIWKKGENPSGMAQVRRFIQKYKYHSTRELDITVPRFGEDPSFVFESLKNTLGLDQRHDPRQINARQVKAFEAEKAKLLQLIPWYKRKKMAKELGRLRQFLWWREELRDLSTQFYDYVRCYSLHLAKLWQEKGWLENPDDIFFLAYTQILALGQGKLTPEQAKQTIHANRLYYQSFRNFTNPNEIGSRYTGAGKNIEQTGNQLQGIAGSAGQVTGRAKVIKDIYDADRLEPGDLLITKFTDPSWTLKFSLIAGVATETGGTLSHAAVISREYGIPAVLAVPQLTQKVQDGQIITIDGNAGCVRLSPDTP